MNYRTNVNNKFTLSSVHYTDILQVLDYQGEKFKLFLERKGISKVKAASMLKISRQGIYKYFETKNLERETVNSILTVFNVSEEEIFGNVHYKPKKDFSVAEDVKFAPFGDERFIDRSLSMIENLEKVINFKKEGLITEDEFVRIKNKIIPKT